MAPTGFFASKNPPHEGRHVGPRVGLGALERERTVVLRHAVAAGHHQRVVVLHAGLGQVQALAHASDAAGFLQDIAHRAGHGLARGVVDDMVLAGVGGDALEGRAMLIQGQQRQHRLAHLRAIEMAAASQ